MGGLKTILKMAFIVLLAFLLLRSCENRKSYPTQPSQAIQLEPIQKSPSKKTFAFKGYTITPLADFEITAKILSREKYYLGEESDISPIDLVLGWGRMADDNVLKTISISQSNRWYYWETKELPIPQREIETHSANMHMIPQDDRLKSVLLNAKKGDIVNIKGALVRVDKGDNWHWQSSLSRDDTGDGACEVIFVESANIEHL
ncbi:MAG: hypothetical protein PHI79_01790 [Sulfurovaceae bacterium]|nr:hypothetical protein [Sulfurovaceae bacterium]MDD5548306.1 hypothetical protein [Sulfurovaceae bacterium]